ncbi:hypothetical protein K7432_016585, partial [Basidiobolus ranarum]
GPLNPEEVRNQEEIHLEDEAPIQLDEDFTISTPMKIITWVVAMIIVLLNMFLLIQVARGRF